MRLSARLRATTTCYLCCLALNLENRAVPTQFQSSSGLIFVAFAVLAMRGTVHLSSFVSLPSLSSLLFSQSFSSPNSSRACFQSPAVETYVSGAERFIVSSKCTCRPPANTWCAVHPLFFDASWCNVSPLMSVPLHSLSA